MIMSLEQMDGIGRGLQVLLLWFKILLVRTQRWRWVVHIMLLIVQAELDVLMYQQRQLL